MSRVASKSDNVPLPPPGATKEPLFIVASITLAVMLSSSGAASDRPRRSFRTIRGPEKPGPSLEPRSPGPATAGFLVRRDRLPYSPAPGSSPPSSHSYIGVQAGVVPPLLYPSSAKAAKSSRQKAGMSGTTRLQTL